MAWTNKQKALVARACKDGGLDDDTRLLILRQVGPRALVNDRVSSTAPRLTNADFESVMTTIETSCGGVIKIKDREGSLIYEFHHWSRKRESGPTQRQHARIDNLLKKARATGLFKTDDRLAGILKQATGGRIESAAELRSAGIDDSRRIADAILNYGSRHGVVWGDLA